MFPPRKKDMAEEKRFMWCGCGCLVGMGIPADLPELESDQADCESFTRSGVGCRSLLNGNPDIPIVGVGGVVG